MKYENERKYRIPDKYIFKKLVSLAFDEWLILQWYDKKGLRTRLEIKKGEKVWTTNLKKEIKKGLREEEEGFIKEEEIDFDKLKSQRMVMKKRYLLNKDPEIVVDELLNPDNCIMYKKEFSEIMYLLEIEEKGKKVDLTKFLMDFLGDVFWKLEDLTYLDGYNNSDFAGEHQCDLNKIVRM
ncbi:hypothetical protein [Petrotoga halophila]|uniref:CYTH domain-containing protein n=1 Tax=Petrotoga halophila DSM 16923 TaxID=1122953 RepID=A0A2S5EH73_9BACT|nr:hypothetical protein [Petrotoga halophila]POZ92492.1 hypothetical protein AA81_06920 [Petrotoga halophila DSM 16923]